MTTIPNPILPGFHPDPSLCRVGDDYYLAVSTFEWFPGVQIFHSRDLANWRLIARPLDRKSQLDMIGVPDSGGVWAPCLSHCDGLFYLIYSNVKHWKGTYIDCPNYLVTAPSIEGPWTDPVTLNSSGIDPSLFHDADGKKWLLNQKWDYRPDNHSFDGIVMQEYDADQKKLVGPIRKIFSGSERRVTEGPHLYKRKDWYYLMTAEGGTSYEHTVTLARAKNIEGPYELHPNKYLVTAHEKAGSLKKAGHGSWAPIDEDTYALVHLCSRLFNDEERCILGRETALQLIKWDEDDWPYLLDEKGEITRDNAPRETVLLPGDVSLDPPQFSARDDFEGPELRADLQSLRIPVDPSWCSISEGKLVLKGQQSPRSRHSQSCIGRRIQALPTRVETRLEFTPACYQQMAGLGAYYQVDCHYYLHKTWHEELGAVLQIHVVDLGEGKEILEAPLPVPMDGPIDMAFTIDGKHLQFEIRLPGEEFKTVGPQLSSTILSDDYVYGFTGAFATLMCTDLSGQNTPATFNHLLVSPQTTSEPSNQIRKQLSSS